MAPRFPPGTAAHGTTGGGGIVNFEVYNNTFIVNSGAVGAGFGDIEVGELPQAEGFDPAKMVKTADARA